jgi:probable HAF family extracellular repeat protein/VCBS repeat-containing protein
MVTYTYTTIFPPGGNPFTPSTSTDSWFHPWSINDSGQITGYNPGFLYDQGTYTLLDVPGAVRIYSASINASGQIAGSYIDGTGPHGFLYDHGTYTILDAPAYSINDSGQIVGARSGGLYLYDHGTYTILDAPGFVGGPYRDILRLDINNSGQIIGTYWDSTSQVQGFLYSNGTFTTLDHPDAAGGTIPQSINDLGQVTGYYGGIGFLYDQGTYTSFSAPGARATFPRSINASGQITGTYYGDPGTGNRGFLYDHGTFTTLDVPGATGPAPEGTFPESINASGQITGYYRESMSSPYGFLSTYGFLATPTTNTPPTAQNDTASASTGIGGTAFADAAYGVLANDSDPDGHLLTVSAVAGSAANVGQVLHGSHGDLTLNADGSGSYTVTDLTGPTGSPLHDVFAYTVSDGNGGTASADLDITLNRAPSASNDIAGVVRGRTIITDAAQGVLANDSDPDSQALAITAVNGAAAHVGQALAGQYGTLTLNADGSFSYASSGPTPLPVSGLVQDAFTYTESDGHGGTATASLTVTVTGPDSNYIAGIPGQTVTGTSGRDVMDGSLGNATLTAGGGSDVLIGAAGDVLTSGLGRDVFLIRNLTAGTVTITDFQLLTDHLELDPGVTVASVSTGSSGLNLHLSSGGDVLLQNRFALPDYNLLF